MEKPSLEQYGLTQRDVESYLKKKEAFDQEYKDHVAFNEKLSLFITWIISSLGVMLIIALIDPEIYEENPWMFLWGSIGAFFFPTLLIFAVLDGPYKFLDRQKEIKARYFNSELENKYLRYIGAINDYNHYLEQIDRNYWIKMTGIQFENEVAALFRKKGYVATVTPAIADGGVDIILTNKNERIAVQCKHHAKPVGPNDVRALQGVVASQNYSKGIFVSLNGYTSSVYWEVGGGSVKVELLELKHILQMAKEDSKQGATKGIAPLRRPTLEEKPQLGDVVTHKNFGDGIIVEINKTTLSVDFVESIKKFSYPGAFLDGFLTLQKEANEIVFGEYSFKGYWMYAKEEYQKSHRSLQEDDELFAFPDEDADYSHLINGLKTLMQIEDVDFKGLVQNYELIYPDYLEDGVCADLAEEYDLSPALFVFRRYLKAIRIKRLSIEGFRCFLTEDMFASAEHLLDIITPEQIELHIERLQQIIAEEETSIFSLAYDRDSDIALEIYKLIRYEMQRKYPGDNGVPTELTLDLFTEYYEKTIATL